MSSAARFWARSWSRLSSMGVPVTSDEVVIDSVPLEADELDSSYCMCPPGYWFKETLLLVSLFDPVGLALCRLLDLLARCSGLPKNLSVSWSRLSKSYPNDFFVSYIYRSFTIFKIAFFSACTISALTVLSDSAFLSKLALIFYIWLSAKLITFWHEMICFICFEMVSALFYSSIRSSSYFRISSSFIIFYCVLSWNWNCGCFGKHTFFSSLNS